MTTTHRALTEAQAIAAYRKIVTGLEKQRGYEPGELLRPTESHITGRTIPQRQGEGLWGTGRSRAGAPALVRDYGSWSTTTDWAIVWEEGPYEWVHYLDGGIEEEFGIHLKPVPMPKGIFAEAIESFSLGLYPEGA
jgi:hypothetical protein